MKKFMLQKTVEIAINNKNLRKAMKNKIDKEIKKKLMNLNRESLPYLEEKRYQWFSALIDRLTINLDNGFINKSVLVKAINTFARNKLSVDRTQRTNEIQEAYKAKYGDYPPMFATISPTQACNLKCVGCYACSDNRTQSFLPYDTLCKVLKDIKFNMGSKFTTISGGEPFMYKDGDKDIFEIFREFNDMYFMVYTNGTLLNEANCKKLAELGNVSPAMSIEGWETETDERRGAGVFKKIIQASENLKKAGVPFGVSVTITSKNADLFLDEKIYDYLYEELGANYMWMFHMMPVGRAKDTLPLIINSQQRIDLFHLWKKLLIEKKYCIADFWNSGAVSDGCIAYGRWGGYFYINWDGKIMPCVFVPFYENSVYDIYGQGKSLGDALQAPLFVNGRNWQKEYGFCSCDKENMLMPCSIRDHYGNFKKNILSDTAIPENAEAEQMIKDPEIDEALIKLENDLRILSEKIWEEEFLPSERETVMS